MFIHRRKFHKIATFILICVILISTGVIPKAAAASVTSAAGLVTTSYGALNVRSVAGTSGSVITKLPNGTYITLISKTGNWWYVEHAAGGYGYVSGDYIKYVYGTYPTTASSTSSSVTVYSGPSGTSTASGSVPSGRTVLVISQSGDWCKILYNGSSIGYVRTQHLKSMMAWPVPVSTKINQYFGAHKGIDIGASVRGVTGDAIIAAAKGEVVYAGWLNGYGYVVYINSVFNGQPIQTRYGHLVSPPFVSAGQLVGIGQQIGRMGNTGTSSGVHLHFEVRVRNSNTACIANTDSTTVNPLDYLR